MATLHAALQSLGPVEYNSLPQDNLPSFLRDSLDKSQLLIDSVPIASDINPPPLARSRANTITSSASSSSEISSSSARPAPPAPEHAALQKEWGKPIKFAAKDNPLGMSVYKMSGKDGRGAWFARRSIHEGLGFKQWKKSMEREFPETMEVQGGPGEGNIRGIGGEKRVEHREIEGIGNLEVYHLSAQFPGPTAPRDFVTLLLTSDTALTPPTSQTGPEPRHYMVISKPCVHPDCPPRDGYIRGQYESIEFIREIPLSPIKQASRSSTDLRSSTFPLTEQGGEAPSASGQSRSQTLRPVAPPTSRPRGKTTSIVEKTSPAPRGSPEEQPGAPSNPVEWIMITRSDPGGNVPRFLVERGTPNGIVSDAGKFLDWACQKEYAESQAKTDEADRPKGDGSPEPSSAQRTLSQSPHDALHANGHLSGIDGSEAAETQSRSHSTSQTHPASTSPPPQQLGYLSSLTSTIGGGLASITPTMISDHFPLISHSPKPSASSLTYPSTTLSRTTSQASTDSISSTVSFETAASFHKSRTLTQQLEPVETTGTGSVSLASDSLPANSREAGDIADPDLAKATARLAGKVAELDARLAKARSAPAEKLEDPLSKEAKEVVKVEERDRKERAKAQERFEKEKAKVVEKREREKKKEEERKKRGVEKEERGRLMDELSRIKRERDALRVVVGELQRENTELVARLGRERPGEVRIGALST
ncbi:MAG: hypothetical protein M1814_003322 [Vezdaea aestivalis]|nr:MAG: hypothetical protein M1814_003322 [Vezdaea aestivalis]